MKLLNLIFFLFGLNAIIGYGVSLAGKDIVSAEMAFKIAIANFLTGIKISWFMAFRLLNDNFSFVDINK